MNVLGDEAKLVLAFADLLVALRIEEPLEVLIRHAPDAPTVHDAEHVLEMLQVPPTAIGSSASERRTRCGVAVAKRRGSSEAARQQRGGGACSRVTWSGAKRSNAAV